ncbi:MAG: Flp pilus assembly complex ATPase component TadA [Acidobacteria bacterium]|nr:Flp pilus assembly complex ATPase component TadA [Acidobacteriota bacterium]
MMKKKRLGEILCERGQLSAADLKKALQEQQGKVSHLGELLLQRNLVSKKDLALALTEVSSVEYVDCQKLQPSASVLKLIPLALAKRCRAIPISIDGKTLTVAMTEPQNVQILDELRFKTGLRVLAKFAFQSELSQALERIYATADAPTDSVQVADDTTGMEFISSSSQERNVEAMREMQLELRQKSKTTPAVQLVATMIKIAVARKASDIHIEPQQNDTAVRFRIDGILRDYQRIPRALQHTITSRVKILSDTDIAERRNPQDGRFLVKINGRRVDLRVSTLPTQYGEKVVMRLLEGESPLKDFATLGIPKELADGLSDTIRLPQGMLLVTGPTGSGKSTTLYSCLHQIRRPAVNVVTVEDPVEYVLPGLNQVQVNVKAGLTFPSCLRSVLRQDPDVVMIGEIRDMETAEIAIKAAQTGHFVLSTLHTNDSISAVTRLLDLGVPGYQIGSALSAIIAQRLVRRLCSCHSSSEPDQEYVNLVMAAGMMEPPQVHNVANGCDLCDFTGYRGRVGIYEMLQLNEPIRQAIRGTGHNDQIRILARHNGMKFMQEYALDLVRDGLTTFEEVQRVVAFGQLSTEACGSCARDLSPNFAFCPYCGVKRHSWHLSTSGERWSETQKSVNG